MTNKHRHAGIPRWIALPAACAVLFLLVPFIALLVRIDWVQFPHLFTQALGSQALALSPVLPRPLPALLSGFL